MLLQMPDLHKSTLLLKEPNSYVEEEKNIRLIAIVVRRKIKPIDTGKGLQVSATVSQTSHSANK